MDALISYLSRVDAWHWLALAAVLTIVELLTGTTLLLWPAVAAGVLGLLLFLPVEIAWQVQLLIFAALTAVSALGGRRFVRGAWLVKADRADVNERAAQLKGRAVIAVGEFALGQGRVKVGDTMWAARLEHGHGHVPDGAALEVVDLDGVTLVVRRV